MDFPVEYGTHLLPEALPNGKRWLVVTTSPILDEVMERMSGHTVQIHQDPSMDELEMERWAQELPGSDAILGIGGGVCMDAAKFLAWKWHAPLYLAPSVISVDASLTDAIAVRRDGKVHYVGKAFPEKVLIEYSLIQGAPAHLNRAGAGDIFSIHTALWDWKRAAEDKGEAYDERIAKQSEGLLATLREKAEEIAEVTEEGIRALVELYAAEVDLCNEFGSSRPEEGSEHFWAYNAEFHTRREYVHGELVALGILLMSVLQDNDVEGARDLAARLKIRWRPEEIGMTKEEVVRSLTTARKYGERDGLAYSVINTKSISDGLAEDVVRGVCGV